MNTSMRTLVNTINLNLKVSSGREFHVMGGTSLVLLLIAAEDGHSVGASDGRVKVELNKSLDVEFEKRHEFSSGSQA